MVNWAKCFSHFRPNAQFCSIIVLLHSVDISLLCIKSKKSKAMDKIKNVSLIFCLSGVFMTSSCRQNTDKGNEEKVITVRTLKVQADEFVDRKEYVGTVEEEQAVVLSFPMQGNIRMIHGREGQLVSKGSVMAEINTHSLKSMHDASLSTLTQAEDGMQRLQQLYDNGSLPEVQYVEAQTKLRQARSMEAIARKNLDDARLIAPFDGIIGSKQVESGENVLPNQPVFTLLKVDKVLVKIPVPETEISDMQLNDNVELIIPALAGKSFDGSIREKGVKAHPLSHTYEVRCEVSNPKKELLPGMVCRVSLQTTGSRVVSIPGRCVQVAADGSKYIWTVSDCTVSKRAIETGRLTANGVIVTKGLQGGEEVVSDGFQKVINGSKVNVR